MKKILAIIISATIFISCTNNYHDFYRNNKSIFKSISALNLDEYDLVSYENGAFSFGENKNVLKQREDSLKILKLLKELGSNFFIYRKNQYISVKLDQGLKGYYYIINKDELIDFDNYSGTLKSLLKRFDKNIAPFAVELDKDWYWIEINQNI